MTNENWEMQVQIVSALIENRENYQRKLGEIASKIQSDNGSPALVGFAEDVKETTGRTISPRTLRNYAWVWDKTSDLDLPEDLTFRAQQALASTDDPKRWLNTFLDDGITSARLVDLIRASRGLNPKAKTTICSFCGKEVKI